MHDTTAVSSPAQAVTAAKIYRCGRAGAPQRPWGTLARTVPRKLALGFASTDDLMAAAGCARRTITVWMELGLLPVPTKVSLGSPGGVFNRFPAWAIERARFIAEKRAGGYTYDEVRAMLDEQDARDRGDAPARSRTTGGAKSGPGGQRRR